jgi:hypothetical protein
MKAALLMLAACTFDVPSYKEPAAGAGGAGAVELCRTNPLLPCGWVYWCGDSIELCLPWDDRAEIPHIKETAESIYGNCELSRDPRFNGTPLCKYQCPPTGPGCNALSPGGCFCLDEAP